MELDPAVVIPAIFFTVVAIYLASSFLIKKTATAEKKKPKVSYGDEIPPSRALGVVQHYEPKVEKPPVMEHKEVKPQVVPPPKEEPVKVTPVVEEIGVAEHQPIKEPEITAVHHAIEVKHVPEPVPEPVVVPELVPEPELVVEPVPEPVVEPEPFVEEAPIPEPVSEPEPVQVPEEEPLPELLPGSDDMPAPEPMVESDPEPEAFEHNDVAAAEDQVKFTPGKKQSKFETLMTQEEIEEEQRIEFTADFTSL